jgi:hypothetical protein
MARTSKPLRSFTVKQITDAFILASAAGSPPIGPRDRAGRGGWYIRVRTSIAINGDRTTEKFDYFYTDADGEILTAPRGYAKDYRPGRIVDIEAMATLFPRIVP